MKRLYLLSPDVGHAEKVVADLTANKIKEKNIYVIARTDMPLEDLPDSGSQDDDFMHAFKLGVSLGGSAGVFVGLVALVFPPAGIVIGGGSVLMAGLAGASLAGLLTGMAGAAFPNSRLEAFEAEIDAGKILLLVDVEQNRLKQIENIVQQLDPDVSVSEIAKPSS